MSEPCQFFDILEGEFPVGAVVSYVHGTFSNSSNGGFAARTALGTNFNNTDNIVKPLGWISCRGTAVNDKDSPLFNGSGRHVPHLAQDRFIRGRTTTGSVGGTSSSTSHTHTTSAHTLSINELCSHTHPFNWYHGLGGRTARKYGLQQKGKSMVKTSPYGGSRSHAHGRTGKANTNYPPFQSLLHLIRYK